MPNPAAEGVQSVQVVTKWPISVSAHALSTAIKPSPRGLHGFNCYGTSILRWVGSKTRSLYNAIIFKRHKFYFLYASKFFPSILWIYHKRVALIFTTLWSILHSLYQVFFDLLSGSYPIYISPCSVLLSTCAALFIHGLLHHPFYRPSYIVKR